MNWTDPSIYSYTSLFANCTNALGSPIPIMPKYQTLLVAKLQSNIQRVKHPHVILYKETIYTVSEQLKPTMLRVRAVWMPWNPVMPVTFASSQ